MQLRSIPPDLRAMAATICDAGLDRDLYPHAAEGGPSIADLADLTTAMNNDVPLEPAAFRQFRVAYTECRQHLRGVSAALLLSDTAASQVLGWTTRIDAVCTEAHMALGDVFPQLRDVHGFTLALFDRKVAATHQEHLDLLLLYLCKVLQQAFTALHGYRVHIDAELAEQRRTMRLRRPTAGEQGTPHPVQVLHRPSAAGAAAGDMSSPLQDTLEAHPLSPPTALLAPQALQPQSAEANREELLDRPSVAVDLSKLPLKLATGLCVANADIRALFAHLQWYVGAVTAHNGQFEVAQHMEDLTMQRVWAAKIGSGRAACTRAEFSKVLEAFPAWLHAAVCDVVDYKGCGVISIYSLQRLLRLWGPLQLLEHNMADDVRSGALCLTAQWQELEPLFARREGAMAGDFVVALTEVPEEVRLIMLRPVQQLRTQRQSSRLYRDSDAVGPLPHVALSYRMSQDSGAWSIDGLTLEEFETIAEACRAFRDVLLRPMGTTYSPTGDIQGADGGGSSTRSSSHSTATTLTAETLAEYSTLHRTCFRNNARYVRTLLRRGAQAVINSPVVDPSVSADFCWTPLLCAVNNLSGEPAEVVRLLLQNGADPHYSDDAACTALYYAIANGYTKAASELLAAAPTLRTSPTTTPLWVALGAHLYHLREADIRRLHDVVPTCAMMEAVAPYVNDYAHLTCGVAILQDALNDVVRRPSPEELVAVAAACQAGTNDLELRTREEEEDLERIARHHTRLCQTYRAEVGAAAAVLYARCYVLSWRHWLQELERRQEEPAYPTSRHGRPSATAAAVACLRPNRMSKTDVAPTPPPPPPVSMQRASLVNTNGYVEYVI